MSDRTGTVMRPAMDPATTEAELLDQLCDVGRLAVERGLVNSSGGNLSGRLPGSDTFLVTGAGTWLDRLRHADFCRISLDGTIDPGGPTPSSEWKLHHRTYRIRSDVNAIVHLHPQHAVLLDAMGEEIRLLSLDHAYYVARITRVPYAPNASDELADTAAEAARDCNCVVLGHHGCSALGPDVAMAFRRAINLEEAAMATYRALTLGDRSARFPPDALAALHHA